jgi:hypothetical protein
MCRIVQSFWYCDVPDDERSEGCLNNRADPGNGRQRPRRSRLWRDQEVQDCGRNCPYPEVVRPQADGSGHEDLPGL